MKKSYHLGSPFGVGLYLHWTFFLLIGFYLLTSGVGGAVLVLALFGCVTLHEYGHVLAARKFGIPTESVTLYPIGGVARLATMPRKPAHELVVALAGPAVNVAIALVLFPFVSLEGVFSGGAEVARMGLASQLFFINIGLAIFNLLPAFPTDGGRVLRAVLAFGRNYTWATKVAARVGQVFALGFIALALLGYGSVFLSVIGVFLFLAAGAERHQVMKEAGTWPGTGAVDNSGWEVLPPKMPPVRRRVYDSR